MNRQKREEALRNSSQPGKQPDQPHQPDRSNQSKREKVRGGDAGPQEHQKAEREPGKLPLPE